ncbi:sensor histidine kinase [Nocardioides kongjuensis]|uniref:histidine kinase n=1 Tax=Nocardioides kongjuensis TaxID=349522 RepID=A0A852RST0_9ACTN|nr:histidine kinase [Nocardioides kongjuensis]NYD33809.1 signal transduction histidine kinase [Nocardioides kongjuensis]
MIGQARAGNEAPFVARRRSRALLVGTCGVLGLLDVAITIGGVLERPDPPPDDLIALWLLAELGAACVAACLLAHFLVERSRTAGMVLALLAPLGAATPAAVVAVVLLVSLRSWRVGAEAVAVLFVSCSATILVVGRERAELLAVLAGAVVVMVLVGLVVGARRALAEQTHRERELVVEQARSQERARIAGEMHDTLSHHLSLIALHAGALGRRDDLPADTVRSSSRLVADLSRTAHAELREVLGVLHRDEVPAAPPAGAGLLPELVEQHRAAGTRVRAVLDPAVVADVDGRLSEATSRLLHRVVRELLANAARHAPGAPVELVVEGGDRVRVECRNPMPGRVERSGDGLGLEGIAERVRLAGGRHRAAPVDGAFVVEVSVPW